MRCPNCSGDYYSTEVFLRGDRSFLRTEETNLGDLTADANLAFEGVANFASFGSEQDALAEYFHKVFPRADNAFNQPDTEPELDERIQNLAFRQDTVIPQ